MRSLTLEICWFYKHQITSTRERDGPIYERQNLATLLRYYIDQRLYRSATLFYITLQVQDI
jgi:hypothetical protein